MTFGWNEVIQWETFLNKRKTQSGRFTHICFFFFFAEKMSYQPRHSRRLGQRGEKRLNSVPREIYFSKKRKKSTFCDCKLILLLSDSVISYFFCTKTNLQNSSTCMHSLRTYVRTGHDIMLIVAMQQKAQIEMRKTSQKTQTKLPCTFIDGAKRC